MKPEALTQRLLTGIPPVLREGSVSLDDLGERPTHHSVVRISGVANLTRDRLVQVIDAVLGEKLECICSDTNFVLFTIVSGKNASRMCVRIQEDNGDGTIATYDPPITMPLAGTEEQPQVLRMRRSG